MEPGPEIHHKTDRSGWLRQTFSPAPYLMGERPYRVEPRQRLNWTESTVSRKLVR